MKKVKSFIQLILLVGFLYAVVTACNKSDDPDVKTPVVETLTDVDGNVYKIVEIGSQVWMAENLKTTKYRDGSPIPNITDNTQWGDLTTGAYCNYDNNVANGNKYGKLYNWFAVNDSRIIAPTGWHIASDDDWTTLENYISTNFVTSESVAKALASKTDWASSTLTGVIGNDLSKNNISGFTGLPGGRRFLNGSFMSIGESGDWWCSTEGSLTLAWTRVLSSTESSTYRVPFVKSCGYSVRCVRD